jgi:4'-phosphopantetheinyl transferase EntD
MRTRFLMSVSDRHPLEVPMFATGLSDQHCQTKRIAEWIATRAPTGTAVAVGLISPSTPFSPEEAAAIARAVPRRRAEFITGRRLAREALAQLGSLAVNLPPDGARLPQWPKGFVGTISHSDRLCVAHVGYSERLLGIGIDIEKIKPIEPALASIVCHPDEKNASADGEPIDPTLLRFVAKEAFFKAYFPVTRTFLDFKDVRVQIDQTSGTFEASLAEPSKPPLCGLRVFFGHITVLSEYILAGIWINR